MANTEEVYNPRHELLIVHVVDSLQIGGIERLVHDLVTARGGNRTAVACLESLGPFGESLRKMGISVELIGRRGGFVSTGLRIWRHLQRVRPDVVHCHNLPASLYGALGARLAGDIPVVMTKHGALVPRKDAASRLCRWLLRRAHVVGVSRQAVGIMQDWLGHGSGVVQYVPNGISPAEYGNLPPQRLARAQLGLPAQSYIIGIVARVTPVKGHVPLIDVFSRIRKRCPNTLLVIVGDGGRVPMVKERIHALGLGNSVLLMGQRQDIPAILAALDVFCLPSEMEGMPITVLEAMAAGLPVVSSRVGGIPELIQHGKTGLLVSPGSTIELEAALFVLLQNPEIGREMGQLARERLTRMFSLEQVLRRYEDIYRGAVVRT